VPAACRTAGKSGYRRECRYCSSGRLWCLPSRTVSRVAATHTAVTCYRHSIKLRSVPQMSVAKCRSGSQSDDAARICAVCCSPETRHCQRVYEHTAQLVTLTNFSADQQNETSAKRTRLRTLHE
jgi:hypothetical protein